MAKVRVREGDYIQMIASLSGEHVSYAPRQVLLVGQEIEVGLANALVNEPPEEPRAEQISAYDAERLRRDTSLVDAEHSAQRGALDTAPSEQQIREERASRETQEPDDDRKDGDGDEERGEGEGDDDDQGGANDDDDQGAGGDDDDQGAGGDDPASFQEEGDVEKRDQNPSTERATSPQAETRETATQRGTRRRPKPPQDEKKG